MLPEADSSFQFQIYHFAIKLSRVLLKKKNNKKTGKEKKQQKNFEEYFTCNYVQFYNSRQGGSFVD